MSHFIHKAQRNTRVELPSNELIDSWTLVRMIGEASIADMDPKGKGIDCIVGKRLTLSNVPGIGAITFAEQDLDDADRQYLSHVLPELPALQIPITDDDARAFLDAYRKRNDRRTWEPMLITEARYIAEQEKRISLRRETGARHRQTLQKLIDAGLLTVYAEGRVPLTELIVGSKILREDAAAYLDLCHIDFGEGIRPSALVEYAAGLVQTASTTRDEEPSPPFEEIVPPHDVPPRVSPDSSDKGVLIHRTVETVDHPMVPIINRAWKDLGLPQSVRAVYEKMRLYAEKNDEHRPEQITEFVSGTGHGTGIGYKRGSETKYYTLNALRLYYERSGLDVRTSLPKLTPPNRTVKVTS